MQHGPRRFRRPGGRRSFLDSAPLAPSRRLRPAGRRLDVLRAILDVWRRPPIPAVAGQGAPQVHDRRLRRRGIPPTGRSASSAARSRTSPSSAAGAESDHMGVHEQKTARPVLRRLPGVPRTDERRQMHRSSPTWPPECGGDIRLTRRQNFILDSIPRRRLDEVVARVGEIGFPLDANGLHGSSIGCIGNPFCNFAVTPTKSQLDSLIERLVTEFGDRVAGLEAQPRRLPARLRPSLDRRHRPARHHRARRRAASGCRATTCSCAAAWGATRRSAGRCCAAFPGDGRAHGDRGCSAPSSSGARRARSFSAFCTRLGDAELIALGTDAGASDVAA